MTVQSLAPGSTAAAALSLRDLHAWYGHSHILHGISFDVAPGEVVALLGRNGSGRTTTLRAIMNLVGRREGSIQVAGRETAKLQPHHISRLGIGYCPEERGIFASLSCEENLLLPPRIRDDAMQDDEIYALFPNLLSRRDAPGTKLAGGEQQMLAMARILRTGARTLLLDEISEGLAPVIVDALFDLILKLRELGFTILLVEQNLHFTAPLADRFIVIERGKVALEVQARDLEASTAAIDRLLGV